VLSLLSAPMRRAMVATWVGSAVLALRVITVVLKNVYERAVGGTVFSHGMKNAKAAMT
jgi:hypothetical protein